MIFMEELAGDVRREKGLDLSQIHEAESWFHDATGAGREFGCAGGVDRAIEKCVEQAYPDAKVEHRACRGTCRVPERY